MINTQKVALMARAAAYQERERKKAIAVNRFFRNDYIGYGMIKSAVTYTVAFVIVAVMWALFHAEELLTVLPLEDLITIGYRMLVLYVGILAVFLVISYFAFLYKYQKAKESIKEYQQILKKLNRLYEKEAEKSGSRAKEGQQP